MSRSRISILATLVLAFFFLRGATAHDIQASNVTVCIRSTGIDVDLTMALASGTLMIAQPNEPLAIIPNTFQDYADRLQSVASGLLTLTTEDNKIFSPDAATVSMTDETDILYTLHFSLHPTGPFTIHAAYLGKMPATHTTSFRILNARGDDLGFGDIHPDSPDFQIKLLAINIPSTTAIAPRAAPPANNSAWMIRAAVAATLLVIILLAWRAITKQRPDSQSPL